MVKLDKIYTRGGDRGQTSLGNGERVSKIDIRVEAYGCVDEANASIGLARLHVATNIDTILCRVQNDLFDVGADLCTPHQDSYKRPPLRIVPAQVTWLEARIDDQNDTLRPLTSFILPGGSPASAHLHMARTVVRRAEREIARLSQMQEINSVALQYMNRLSDLLFVLARRANAAGEADVLWVPGASRAD